jgi:hypothetical protein
VNKRFDLPSEVVAQRGESLVAIRRLLAEDTLEATRRAAAIQREWLDQYPDDYVMWDAGEVLAMTENAILATEPVAVLK